MGGLDLTTRWLIVLQPNQRGLYEVLRQGLKEDSPVTVIYDRRFRERRRGSDSPRTDRRRTERRQRRPSGWLYETTETIRIIETDDSGSEPAKRPRTERGLGSHECSECGTEVEFEMPRFPQPPARLEIETIHSGAQHFVEIHAFTPTGRPLLSQRNQAWRRGG